MQSVMRLQYMGNRSRLDKQHMRQKPLRLAMTDIWSLGTRQ
jgi:hypothetical protein